MFSELSDVAENLDLNVEDVLALGPSHFTAAYAGYATVAAARTVIRDETLDESVSGELTLAVPLWGTQGPGIGPNHCGVAFSHR